MLGEEATIFKADTCTESMDVYAAGISRKVARITRGGLLACHVLPARQRAGMGRQKSAEAIVVDLTTRRRAKPAKRGMNTVFCLD